MTASARFALAYGGNVGLGGLFFLNIVLFGKNINNHVVNDHFCIILLTFYVEISRSQSLCCGFYKHLLSTMDLAFVFILLLWLEASSPRSVDL